MLNHLIFISFTLLISSHSIAFGSIDEVLIDEQKDFLSTAILGTPYSAVVKHTDVKVLNSNALEFDTKHVYTAEVINTIRGHEQGAITYTMFVEYGEDAVLDTSPVIITLCVDDSGYYWPGVGAQFYVSEPLVQYAEKIVKSVDINQSYFSHCE
ncbi:hypothetical protein [Vibrio vulnificus]|uniref:hypothetical protein n=1 Tax=Vibrio vulnificus TaxID=672 RepID=UPI001028F514|nr:hypothetical protein [Vibrio vulnificus]EGQ8024392.1 hypothetical protein [Vibrio vulnificus]EHU4850552.1 hypothetical protein [Vibrio vulnificus]RZQ71993.1 hypothetical protein D8T30_15065 [Vibrio vulnificus]RZQ96382.1 hypothetical protein D8T29_14800 [Vibrio vulnificus]RZR43821.1 hypothetical protein D8T35_21985 [Vibrio vulnificus]